MLATRLPHAAVLMCLGLTTVSLAQTAPQDPGAPTQLDYRMARSIVFPREETNAIVRACDAVASRDAAIDCLLRARFSGDARATEIALALRRDLDVIVGVEEAHTMNGGFRGQIQIVGATPLGHDRQHLEWLNDALRDFDTFVRELQAHAPQPMAYRARPQTVRFMRSVGRTTPSAYALGWNFSYSVSGSLMRNADSVRETLFHEIFHLNDAVHTGGSGRRWSERVLGSISRTILRRCGANRRCLTPFAPSNTTVRGGTYYAFQQDNGGDSIVEYAAELALRYYQEQRTMLRHEPFARGRFKCGPSENARAWGLLRDEFFGGADLVPACEQP